MLDESQVDGVSPHNAHEVPQIQSSEIVSGRKIGSLRNSFAAATPEIRTLLGVEHGKPDTHFIGVFGSCVTGKANERSDIDGYLFYKRTETTPSEQHLDYDLAHTFDSPAQSLLGYPEGHKPPNPQGLEDIEAHDITRLPQVIAKNGRVDLRKLREIAILFSPVTIGDEQFITDTKNAIREALIKRTGKPYDSSRYGDHQKHVYGDFEDYQGNGDLTWKLVQEEYRKYFEKELEPLAEKESDIK